MKIHQLYRQQIVPISLEEAWAFFSSPHFLNEITPSFFKVEIQSDVPDDIYAGLLISYRMKAVFNIPMDWLSEISHCDQYRYFIYQQQEGPFKFWSHEVRFTATPAGTMVEDIVFYTMPGWLFGELLHWLSIGKRLQAIFDTRQNHLQQRWETH